MNILGVVKSYLKLKLHKKQLTMFKIVGENVQFDRSCVFGDSENIEVGSNVYIGENAYFWGKGGLKIGSNVSFGPDVKIHTVNHRWENATSIPYDGCSIKAPVEIGNHVWIGGHVTIIPGVKIGEGAIVAMGAVVVKNVESCTIVGGNPARVLKTRNVEHFNEMKKKKRFWHQMAKDGKTKYKFIEKGDKVSPEDVLKIEE